MASRKGTSITQKTVQYGMGTACTDTVKKSALASREIRDFKVLGMIRYQLSLLLQYEEEKEVGVGVSRRDKQNTKHSTVRYVYCIFTVNDNMRKQRLAEGRAPRFLASQYRPSTTTVQGGEGSRIFRHYDQNSRLYSYSRCTNRIFWHANDKIRDFRHTN